MRHGKLKEPKLTCFNTDLGSRRTLERLADHFSDKEEKTVYMSEVFRRAVLELARKEKVPAGE